MHGDGGGEWKAKKMRQRAYLDMPAELELHHESIFP